ncbi:MAG: isocitrate lyase/PEP mutase family protein [Candidatus Atribacteria bacterium]|nr:isocitrate lyase/PEP mutase family protein [Candidatus Atribacteria bacterium]
MRKTKKLRLLLREKRILVAPGAYDVLSAKMIEQIGFKVVYMTGYGTSATVLGQPDVGLLTMTEMANRAGRIAQAVKIPVIADADTGYGNPLNVRRTVMEYERAGVSGIQLEDQVFPKKCGHMLGRKIIPTVEMVQKIKAACEARMDKDFVIIARTDARTNYGLEEAIARGKAYEEAGADIIFIESPENISEMKKITDSFSKTFTLVNMVEGGKTPILSAEELERLGFSLVIFSAGPLFAAAKGLKDYLNELKAKGTTIAKLNNLISFSEFNKFIGLEYYLELEKRYLAD